MSEEIAKMWAVILGYGHTIEQAPADRPGEWDVVWSGECNRRSLEVRYETARECFSYAVDQEIIKRK